jgi:hypothetical protein
LTLMNRSHFLFHRTLNIPGHWGCYTVENLDYVIFLWQLLLSFIKAGNRLWTQDSC